jgi:hypothetical protein
MSIVIRYIILNDKISCLEEHANKLLFLYNYRSYYKLKWLIYAWAPLPNEVQKKIINIYNTTNLYLTNELIKLIFSEHNEIIKKTQKDIDEKTFIKFLYDLKYINKNLLLLFNTETKVYPNNPGFVLDKENKNFKITIEEMIKIEKYKNNKDKNFYRHISFNFDKYIIKKFAYYVKELIKIENEWWLITTCYKDRIEEDLETQKIICWIFSINV